MAKKLWALSLYAEQEETTRSGNNLQIRRKARHMAGSVLAETAGEAEREGMAWLAENYKKSDGWSAHDVVAAAVLNTSMAIALGEAAREEAGHADQAGE